MTVNEGSLLGRSCGRDRRAHARPRTSSSARASRPTPRRLVFARKGFRLAPDWSLQQTLLRRMLLQAEKETHLLSQCER